MTRRTGTLGCAAGIAVVALLVVAAMVWLTRGARTVSGSVRRVIDPPGPALAAGDVPRVLGDVPLAPFLTVDLTASNDPRTRLEALMRAGHGPGQWILLARNERGFSMAVEWYRERLQAAGWELASMPGTGRDRDEDLMAPTALWVRGDDRFALAQVPERPDHVWLFVSTPPPGMEQPDERGQQGASGEVIPAPPRPERTLPGG